MHGNIRTTQTPELRDAALVAASSVKPPVNHFNACALRAPHTRITTCHTRTMGCSRMWRYWVHGFRDYNIGGVGDLHASPINRGSSRVLLPLPPFSPLCTLSAQPRARS